MERTFISTGERIRNYLGIGLLLSLMLNALVTPLYPNLTTPHTDVKREIISIFHPASIRTQPPTPTPPPQPHRPLAHAHAPPIAINPPKLPPVAGAVQQPYVQPSGAISNGIPGPPVVLPTSGATAGVATAGPLCSNPNQDASVINPMSPMYPDSARDQGLGAVSVLIEVTIDAQGRLIDAKIYQSSKNAAIDQAALRAARQTTYAPRIANCAAVPGTYIFHADFEPN